VALKPKEFKDRQDPLWLVYSRCPGADGVEITSL